MLNPTNHLVSLAYVTSIGLAGSFIAKKTVYAAIWSWNKCASDNNQISLKSQEKISKVCEYVGGLFFAALAAREVCSESMVQRQLKTLKQNLRSLEKEVSDLFNFVYNRGTDAIHNFTLDY